MYIHVYTCICIYMDMHVYTCMCMYIYIRCGKVGQELLSIFGKYVRTYFPNMESGPGPPNTLSNRIH